MNKEKIIIAASSVYGAKYDAAAKVGFHNPKLIAPILKNVIPEYRNYSYEEIVQFIQKDSINDDPVDDVSALANQMDTESISISDKLIRYDSRFKAINPKLSDTMMNFNLHIDLEVQNNYKPSNPVYPIVKRGIYYGARELSSQLGILTDKTDYNKLEKVYSIWICNENVPKCLQNTVTSYRITKTDEIGLSSEPQADFDLMTVIIIRRGEHSTDANIFDYLEAYFESDIERIGKYVDVDDEVKEEVENMTGLGETIYNKGVAQGMLKTLIELVQKGLIQIADAAEEANMSETEFSELLNNK